MLVLSRTQGGRILLGKPGDVLTEPIEVMLVALKKGGHSARIGIHAQEDIQIIRSELAEPSAGNGEKEAA